MADFLRRTGSFMRKKAGKLFDNDDAPANRGKDKGEAGNDERDLDHAEMMSDASDTDGEINDADFDESRYYETDAVGDDDFYTDIGEMFEDAVDTSLASVDMDTSAAKGNSDKASQSQRRRSNASHGSPVSIASDGTDTGSVVVNDGSAVGQNIHIHVNKGTSFFAPSNDASSREQTVVGVETEGSRSSNDDAQQQQQQQQHEEKQQQQETKNSSFKKKARRRNPPSAMAKKSARQAKNQRAGTDNNTAGSNNNNHNSSLTSGSGNDGKDSGVLHDHDQPHAAVVGTRSTSSTSITVSPMYHSTRARHNKHQRSVSDVVACDFGALLPSPQSSSHHRGSPRHASLRVGSDDVDVVGEEEEDKMHEEGAEGSDARSDVALAGTQNDGKTKRKGKRATTGPPPTADQSIDPRHVSTSSTATVTGADKLTPTLVRRHSEQLGVGPMHSSQETPDATPHASTGQEEANATAAEGAERCSATAAADIDAFELDEDEEDNLDELFPRKEGVVFKWTNYIYGWQERYLVLQKGNLSYYKSKDDTTKLCRGTMDLTHAKIRPHQYDTTRVDISVRDQMFQIKVTTPDELTLWVQAMEDSQKTHEGTAAGGRKGLRRQPSTLSLASIASGTLSGGTTTVVSIANGNGNGHATTHQKSVYRTFTDKYTEARALLEAFTNQIEGLNLALIGMEGSRDIKRQSALLKSTSTGLMRSTREWMDLMAAREEEWQRKYDRVNDKRKRAIEELRNYQAMERKGAFHQMAGPDHEEGPHSLITEEEFFDAMETGLDQLEKDEEETRRERELEEARMAQREAMSAKGGPPNSKHRFSDFIEEKLADNLKLANEPLGDLWTITHEEKSMKVYARAGTNSDDVTNQQKCLHFIKGITAKELCHYFASVKLRLDWENTLEKIFVLEFLDDDTTVQHNLHKRVWPTAQRDSVILCHIRRIEGNTWAVQSVSVEHDDAPRDKYVRLEANIFFYAETVLPDGYKGDASSLSRDQIGTKLQYLAYIHPGGWAPVSVVKAVSKREFPKFLRNLEKFSTKHYAAKPIDL